MAEDQCKILVNFFNKIHSAHTCNVDTCEIQLRQMAARLKDNPKRPSKRAFWNLVSILLQIKLISADKAFAFLGWWTDLFKLDNSLYSDLLEIKCLYRKTHLAWLLVRALYLPWTANSNS
jgi:hypothetical protein